MSSRVVRKPKPSPRSVRSDGAETRLHILQVAGQLFAEKGFERTTSREICSAAGTNLAAVNYHFGSRDGLYDAVLVEAHGQIVGLDDLESISRSGLTAEAKLRELIGLIVRRSSATNLPWGLRVLVREFMSPSVHVNAVLRQAVLPKLRVVLGMIAEFLGVPQEHPLVQRGCRVRRAPVHHARRRAAARAAPGIAGVDGRSCRAGAGHGQLRPGGLGVAGSVNTRRTGDRHPRPGRRRPA